MAIDPEYLANFIEEHLPYEFSMLKHTYARIHEVPNEADWNAFLESFCIHARIIKEFFVGDRGNANNGLIASDFINFTNARVPSNLTGPFIKLNEQITHLGRSRPTDGSAKFTRAHAEKVVAWLAPLIQNFLNALSPTDKRRWNAAAKNPKKYLIHASDTVPGASSVISQMSSTTLPSFPQGSPYVIKF
jgi:hypothetical protein